MADCMRLPKELKLAQGELNSALTPLLKQVHMIHDDLIIAAKSKKEHDTILQEVLEIISKAGLTLNPKKCVFYAKEIEFWGLIISAEGVRPNPKKIDALQHIASPENKAELVSFLCMMQSNADFTENFS